MFKANEYFDGEVASIAFQGKDKPMTVGVMAIGEFEFGTELAEVMTVVSGVMTVRLPGEDKWQTYLQNQSFNVPEESKFQVKIEQETAYLCQYG